MVLVVKRRWRIDDSLDVFAVHGVGGALGALLLAPFADSAWGGLGLREGFTVPSQLLAQAIGVAVGAAWAGVASWVLLKLIDAAVPLRVSEERERQGLDIASHGESAYNLS
jgi:Amt family ammonium transporter